MQLELSYWEVEEAVIDYLKKNHNWEVDSDQIEGGIIETSTTDYAFKKDKDGDTVVDSKKSVTKKESLAFDGNSDMSFWIGVREESDVS